MRKTERLDQILIRLGYVTLAQVNEAVARQRAKGGRIGTNLVELGALTEEQLFDGLVEQFRVPTVTVDRSVVEQRLLDRLPVGLLEESLVVPVGWNEALGVLSVAVANPSDDEAIERVRAAFGAKKVRVSLAPESVLADLAKQLGAGGGSDDGLRLVALPELFETATETDEIQPPAVVGRAAVARRVLMVAQGAARRDFLPAVFKPEGCALRVVASAEEAGEAIEAGVDDLLVTEEMEELFREWVATGTIPPPGVEVTVFRSVSDALLDNPTAYENVAASVRATVQAVAEYRSLAEGVAPPYTLMAMELEAMAERVKLSRLATDGLNVGVHLLVPVASGSSIDPFRSFAATIELAHRLRFPWPVDNLLSNCLGLYLGRVDLTKVPNPKEEVLLAAQVLALVWFRHNLAGMDTSDPNAEATEERAVLRQLVGRLATLDVIEEYLEVVAERDDDEIGSRSVLLVGQDRAARALGPALTRIGAKVALAGGAKMAQAAVEKTGPDAIIVDHSAFGAATEKLCRMLRVDRSALIFVLTDDPDPALVLNLLDIGVDDVFAPPHDFDVISARVHRSLRSRAAGSSRAAPEGQFSANFGAFSFIDLAQMLANSQKSVRVDLRGGGGQEAVLYLERGRPVHAACGALAGPPVVYHVIGWEDNGAFTVDETDEFPPPNIQESVEALLMEGVRLLDESRA